jgi:glycerol-3-phosphate dehydrogenase (NAD(P)+)
MSQPHLTRCAVLGAGSWGTALAMQLGRCGHEVWLWDHRADRAAEAQAARQNRRYLPGRAFPDTLTVTGDMDSALDDAELVVTVVPSHTMRSVMAAAAPALSPRAIVCCASKGIEEQTVCTMDEVLQSVLPEALHGRICALSGPSFAAEVANDLPTAVVVAGRDDLATHRVAAAFHGSNFRVYTSDDLIGVEIGGALKNVMAIACGVADGMGLGPERPGGHHHPGPRRDHPPRRLSRREPAHPGGPRGHGGLGVDLHRRPLPKPPRRHRPRPRPHPRGRAH